MKGARRDAHTQKKRNTATYMWGARWGAERGETIAEISDGLKFSQLKRVFAELGGIYAMERN